MSNLFADFQNGLGGGLSQPPKSLTANTNGVGVDLQNADVRGHLIVGIGVLTDNAVFSVSVQGSNDNTTFAALADTANTNTGNLNTSNTNTILSFNREYRYVRAVATLQGGGNNAAGVICSAIYSQKKYSGGGAGASSGVDRSPST